MTKELRKGDEMRRGREGGKDGMGRVKLRNEKTS